MESYAEVLESYLIPAEEGLIDKLKSAGKFVWNALKKAVDFIKSFILRVSKKHSESNDSDNSQVSYDLNSTCNKAIREAKEFVRMTAKAYEFMLKSTPTDDDYYDKMDELSTKVDNSLDNLNELTDKIKEYIDEGKKLNSKNIKSACNEMRGIVNEMEKLMTFVHRSMYANMSEAQFSEYRTTDEFVGRFSTSIIRLARLIESLA